MAAARRRGGALRGKVGRPPSIEPPAWTSLTSAADVRAGLAWTAAALIQGRIDAKSANAFVAILGGATRAMQLPVALAEVPALRPFMETILVALDAFPEARAAVVAGMEKALAADRGETPTDT